MSYNKKNPFFASIKDRYVLNKEGSKKKTHHIVLDLKDSHLFYKAGESVGIFPSNDESLVQKILQFLKCNETTSILDKHSQERVNLRTFLAQKASISTIQRKFIQVWADRISQSAKKQFLSQLLLEEKRSHLKEFLESREVWDFIEEYPEVTMDCQEFCNLLMPLLPRFYSIASSNQFVGDEVHLTVAYLQYDSAGQARKGVCTHYLCHLAPLHEPRIPLFIQPAHEFGLPENPAANIIMIGPGTGIAPFRAFMQERVSLKANGKNWLFFGEWNRETDYLYEEFWNELIAKRQINVDLAFSRDQAHKIYVQDRMKEKGHELFQWLEHGAYLYVCGDAKRMARDVDTALLEIVKTHGKLSEVEAKGYLKKLKAEKRYQRDVY